MVRAPYFGAGGRPDSGWGIPPKIFPKKALALVGLFYLTEMKFYTYILQSQKDGKIYIGQTQNLEERLLRHNSNLVRSTKNKGPWNFIYHFDFETRSEAMAFESQLKAFKNNKKVLDFLHKISTQ